MLDCYRTLYQSCVCVCTCVCGCGCVGVGVMSVSIYLCYLSLTYPNASSGNLGAESDVSDCTSSSNQDPGCQLNYYRTLYQCIVSTINNKSHLTTQLDAAVVQTLIIYMQVLFTCITLTVYCCILTCRNRI